MLSFLRTRSSAAPTESEALSSLRAALSEAGVGPSGFLSDACLLRYLRARGLDVRKALVMLQGTLAWRAAYRPERVLAEHGRSLRAEAGSGKMMVLRGADRAGRAVIVMRPGLENSDDAAGNVRFLVYTLERAAMVARGGDGRFTVLVDYAAGRFGVGNSPSMAVMRETTGILQNHYPERLGGMFFYDAPAFLVGMLKMLRPFIDAETREKLFFVKAAHAAGDENVRRVLDLQHVPKAYGGEAELEFEVGRYFEEDEFEYV